MKIYFSDFFDVDPDELDAYGAFNVSLINDLPLFIDPFLLFNSDNAAYRELHAEIIRYVAFLRDVAREPGISPGLMAQWYHFKEVKQTWLGYCLSGNDGSGLGPKFAHALHRNLSTIFANFGQEEITKGSHLEKLCLVRDGVGKDNISDFATNLIKGYLCKYTETFAVASVDASRLKEVAVRRVSFNYETRSWVTGRFLLPFISGDHVLLVPKDLLTKDEAWINRHELIANFDGISDSIPNVQLRAQVNEYFLRVLPADPKQEEIDKAVIDTITNFPEFIDYYIKLKEERGAQAKTVSALKVRESESIFIKQVRELSDFLRGLGEFYEKRGDTYQEALARVLYLKDVIENNDGYRYFYVNGKPVKREKDLHVMYRLTWFAAPDSADSEVNNGRGPVDFKISRGSRDSTVVEFKLGSNKQLKKALMPKGQVDVYKAASNTKKAITAILCFEEIELERAIQILNELGLTGREDIVLIDGSRDNKPSASTVR